MNNPGNLYGIAHAGRSVTFRFPDPTEYIAKKIIDSKVFYELDVLEEISSLGLGNGLFVDVGANIGNHSLFFSIILDREVVAFEPAEEAFSQLVQNIRLNRAENLVTCYRIALGATQGRGHMNMVPGNLGASHFTADGGGGVQLETLDSLLYEKNRSIALIKIDVEGSEVEVLRGAVKVLERDAPLLIVEGQTDRAFGQICEFLSSKDYIPISIRGITPTYFFVHRSRLSDVQDRSIFYIRNDVDHNRRILQSYLARIETNLRAALTKAEFEKLSAVLEVRQKELINKVLVGSVPQPHHFDRIAEDIKVALGGLINEQGQKAQLLSDVIEHRFRVLTHDLVLESEKKSKLVEDLLEKIQDSGEHIAERLIVDGHERTSRLEELSRNLAESVAANISLQTHGMEQQQGAIQVIESLVTEEAEKFKAAAKDMASAVAAQVREASSTTQRALLARSDLSLQALGGQVSSDLESFASVMNALEARISSMSASLPNEISKAMKLDISTSVDNGVDSVRTELVRLGTSIAAHASPEATSSKVLQRLTELEAHVSNAISSNVENLQRKAIETLRTESEKLRALRDRDLEHALSECDYLNNEVNRLVVAVQTERVRARYAARRLGVLYSTGVRAAVGKIRRLLSPLTFGLVKPYETWAGFEKRMEARVSREVQDFKKLHASSLRRSSPTFISPSDELVEGEGKVKFAISTASGAHPTQYRDRVRIGIASIEIRRTALSRVIDCLYDQADEIFVYLNDYSEIPKFLNREKIQVIHKMGDVGDRGKFFDIDNFSGYFFTCDDDIEYPPYYVQHCVDAIERYGRKAVVGWHGSLLKTPFVDYYSSESRRVFSFRSGRPEDTAVHILGTGCSSFHTETLKVSYADFLTPNMADVYFALLGQKQRVPFVVIKHDPAEALPLDIPDDKPIHRESMQKTGSRADTREIQNRCVKDWQDWRAEKPASTIYSRASYTIAYVGRVDTDRWKKGGILKSGGLITQALRAIGHRVVDIEISQPLDAILEQVKTADIVWIYPGDPERPDFAPVEALIERAAKVGKQVYVNLSYNLIESRTRWIQGKLTDWNRLFGNRVKACVFTYAAMNEPAFHNIRQNLICIPKSIDFSDDIRASFMQTEGIFIGDLQKLLNRNLVDGDIEDWINPLRESLPGVPLYAVRQYGGKIDRELGLTVVPYTQGRAWEEWLASKRIVCCLTPHATYEMIPIEAGGFGVPSIYRPMPQSHSENLSTAGIQVHSPKEFAAACAAIYHDHTLWTMYSRAAAARARSTHISHVAASLHMQLTLGKLH